MSDAEKGKRLEE